MILKYDILEEIKLEDIKLEELEKDDNKIQYMKPDDFDDFKEAQLDKGNNVVVLRNTTLKKFKDDEEPKEYLLIGETKYKLKDEKSKKAKGYIYVGNNQFVRIEDNFIFIILLILLLLSCIIGGLLTFWFNRPGDSGPERPGLQFEDEDEWDGTQYQNGEISVESQESTIIPGFSKIQAREGASLVQLYNPDENTVYFVYTVTQQKSNEVDKEFLLSDFANEKDPHKAAQDAAQKHVNENQLTYNNYLDEATGDYMVEILEDHTYTNDMVDYKVFSTPAGYEVRKIVSDVVWFSKAIAPGNKIDWDVKECFDQGEHKGVQLRISTYDVNTEEICYGATLDVELEVLN